MPKRAQAEVRSYKPTMRERVAQYFMGDDWSLPRQNLVEGLLGTMGLGETKFNLVDFAPAGSIFGVQEAYRAGDPQGMAVAVLPLGVAARTAAQASTMWHRSRRGYMIRRRNHRAHSRRIIRPEPQPMPQDDSRTASKDARSPHDTLSAEERWAERMKPSCQRNLTAQQRQSLARFLRALRRKDWVETQEDFCDSMVQPPEKAD